MSAAWNEPAPGYVTQDFPCYQIDASELQPCDALLDPSEHVALFIGKDSSYEQRRSFISGKRRKQERKRGRRKERRRKGERELER